MKYLLLLLCLSLFVISCNKDDDHSDNSLEQKEISGTIILPSGIDINTEQWSAHSPLADGSVVGNKFELNIFKNTTSTILIQNGDKVVLMGYRRIGEGGLEITTESTAKALIMCLPIMASIAAESRFQIIDNAAILPEFETLKTEIESNLVSGNDLFDLQNEALFTALGNVIQKISSNPDGRLASKKNLLSEPVQVEQDNRNLTFSNNHIAYTTVIGIYKDEQKLNTIQIDGVDAFPTSISNLANGIFGGGTTLFGNGKVSEAYNFNDDGNYKVKIRTGLPLQDDDTEEYDQALRANLIHASKLALNIFLPAIENENTGCFTNLAQEVCEAINDAENLDAKKAVYLAFKHTLKSTENFYKCVYGKNLDFSATYFGKVGKLYSVFSELADRIDNLGSIYANTGNLTFLATQWAIANPKVDLCLMVEGGNVNMCCGNDAVTDIDGNTYDAIMIGTQCWMKQNLHVSHYKNGDIIPQVTDKEEWGYLTTGAWCYYENITANDTMYGKLYNWYAVNDSRGIAPEGWHVPESNEWNGVNANNFMGLKGGYVYEVNGENHFIDLGNKGYWWTSTTVGGGCGAQYYVLDSGLSAPVPNFPCSSDYDWHFYKFHGYSVRCVKD
jgi:Fibrobacter succinogenes major domain (Fib_succ_major)